MILITGGTGYIGSHTVVKMLEKNYDVAIMDNMNNSKIEVLDNIEKLTGIRPKFYKVDLLDKKGIEKIFAENHIDCVMHFAALKAVGESVENPLMYYENNVLGTINILSVMKEYNCSKFVFSSSAGVYAVGDNIKVDENSIIGAINPYGRTKLMIEEIIRDISIADESFSCVILRYFNAVGAHKSGLIGESPNGIPNNLVPYICKVANKELEYLRVFGDDYDTVDGTGVRDYIHVEDLAIGHVMSMNKLQYSGVHVYTLGTGKGYSVLEVVDAFEKANNIKINYRITPRRAGDVAILYADTKKAEEELGFKAIYDIEDMCKDSWRFIKKK